MGDWADEFGDYVEDDSESFHDSVYRNLIFNLFEGRIKEEDLSPSEQALIAYMEKKHS